MYDPNYSADRAFGDRFMPEVRSIMGRILLTGKYGEEDKDRNTDLVVVTMDRKRIAVRVRRHRFYDNYDRLLGCPYRDEFTLRWSKSSGSKTEFEKLITGFGDYFFYAYADENDEHLQKWVVIDLAEFRKFVILSLWKQGGAGFVENRLCTVGSNGDKFISFRISELPKEAIVADSEHWTKVTA